MNFNQLFAFLFFHFRLLNVLFSLSIFYDFFFLWRKTCQVSVFQSSIFAFRFSTFCFSMFCFLGTKLVKFLFFKVLFLGTKLFKVLFCVSFFHFLFFNFLFFKVLFLGTKLFKLQLFSGFYFRLQLSKFIQFSSFTFFMLLNFCPLKKQ